MARHRKPGKQELIVNMLRERIVRGELAPGAPLPSRRLMEDFATGAAIVQQAVNTLVTDGFLITRERSGTFVSLTPPHQCRYGVVFPHPSPISNLPRGSFEAVYAYECLTRTQTPEQTLSLYFGVTGHTDEEDFQRLLADIRAQRLAGVIFLFYHGLNCVPELQQACIPQVLAIKHVDAEDYPLPYCDLDHRMFMDKALNYFVQRGRKHIATIPDITSVMLPADEWQTALAAQGFSTDPAWNSRLHTGEPQEIVRHYTHLLLRDPAHRPDGFIITDDCITEMVVNGIADAGLRIGQDVDVIAHCNYPLMKQDQVPLVRLGYAVGDMLDHALALIDRRQAGEAVPDAVMFPALFADELVMHVS